MGIFYRTLFCVATYLTLLFIKIEASEIERIKNIDNLRLAFELQCHAKSYLDSYNNCVLFNSAEAQLEKLGEPKHRLAATRNLWLWYRKYGYSIGLLENPVQSPDEYLPQKKSYRFAKDYKDMNTHEQRWTRDFLTGVGMTISGIFCITVHPPVLGKFGVALVMTGGGYMYNAVNNMWVDSQEKNARLRELTELQKRAEESALRK
jgi:hypothetical protein